jgi:hypothetical protein
MIADHRMDESARLAALMSLTPEPDPQMPKVKPPTGPLFWSAETAREWDRKYQWPEDRDRVRRMR